MAQSSDPDSGDKNNEEVSDKEDNSDEKEDGFDINASSTDSDEDDSNIDEENESEIKSSPTTKSPAKHELLIDNFLMKYAERQGKQLYIRFSAKLPTDEDEFQQQVKALSPLVIKAHKPRQKHARFCLVDFSSTEDRNTALESIRNASKDNQTFKGIVISLPRTENKKFLEKLVEKKRYSMETKKAKERLKRESKKALRSQNFTSSVVILNLPKSASISEVRKNFTNAVDIQIKPGRGKFNGTSVASITLPSTKDARAAVKKRVSLGGTELVIRFDTKKLLHGKKKNQKRKLKPEEVGNQKTTKKTRKI